MKALAAFLSLLLLTAAASKAGLPRACGVTQIPVKSFYWRDGREDITTAQRLYRPARPGLEIFGPAVDQHLTYSFNSTLYCEVRNSVSHKTMITHIFLVDLTHGTVVYELPKTEVLPGQYQSVNQEVNPDPRFKCPEG
jgi:hypothetical protein